MYTDPMRCTALILALAMQAAFVAPALAQMCDTRCDEGEVWTEVEGGTCVPVPPPTS